jgi:hypothetical protein
MEFNVKKQLKCMKKPGAGRVVRLQLTTPLKDGA